jgi:hypothetical protein
MKMLTFAAFAYFIFLPLVMAQGDQKVTRKTSSEIPYLNADPIYQSIPSDATACFSSIFYILPNNDPEGALHGSHKVSCSNSAGAILFVPSTEVRGVPAPEMMVPQDMALFKKAGFRAVSCQLSSDHKNQAGFNCFYQK